MSTITREIAEELIARNGCFQDDPQAYAILTYQNMFTGDLSWAVAYSQQDLARYYVSDAINFPTIVWPLGAPSDFGQFVDWRKKYVN